MGGGGGTAGWGGDKPPIIDITDAFGWCRTVPIRICKMERVYVAATKARPATDEPVKRTATKTPAKKAPAAKSANGSAPAKRATKTTAAKSGSGPTTKARTAAKHAKSATAAKSQP